MCRRDCAGILSGATLFLHVATSVFCAPTDSVRISQKPSPLSTSVLGCDYWHECIDDKVAEVPAVNGTMLYYVRIKHGETNGNSFWIYESLFGDFVVVIKKKSSDMRFLRTIYWAVKNKEVNF